MADSPLLQLCFAVSMATFLQQQLDALPAIYILITETEHQLPMAALKSRLQQSDLLEDKQKEPLPPMLATLVGDTCRKLGRAVQRISHIGSSG